MTFTIRILLNLLTNSVAAGCLRSQAVPRLYRNFGDDHGPIVFDKMDIAGGGKEGQGEWQRGQRKPP